MIYFTLAGMLSQVALDGAFVIRSADAADTQPNHRYFVTLWGGGVTHHVGIRYEIPEDQDDDVRFLSFVLQKLTSIE